MKHFANAGLGWVADCGGECDLFSPNRKVIRFDHLAEQNPDLFHLLHLPILSSASKQNDSWYLGLLDIELDVDLPDRIIAAGDFSELKRQHSDVYIIRRNTQLHEATFYNGMRFMPTWLSMSIAEQYRSNLNDPNTAFIERSPIAEVERNSLATRHNYLCVQRAKTVWETYFIEKRLRLRENTLVDLPGSARPSGSER